MSGSRSTRQPSYDPNVVEVKSKFECEFRRFSMDRTQVNRFNDFHSLVKESHHLPTDMPFTVSYTDPRNGDLLPINNDDNLMRAFTTAMPLLRLFIYRKQEFMLEDMNAKARKKSKGDSKRISTLISAPQDFRRVCAIVDADMLPDTVRRVKLLKHSSDKPLGFYIRDGTSVRVTPYGLEKVPGIFISRLVPGGLAEGTGLLAVNDEILEVNGIEVLGKSLDQVTDMMVANSQNLIITVKPASAPPPTPRAVPATSKKAKPLTPNASVKSGSALSTVVAKSHSDLPSVTATPPQPSKHQSPNSTQSHSRTGSDLKKVESWGDSLDRISSTSNGPTNSAPRKGTEQEDIIAKRHSVGGALESS